jgi:small subunit ribosomal protein S16
LNSRSPSRTGGTALNLFQKRKQAAENLTVKKKKRRHSRQIHEEERKMAVKIRLTRIGEKKVPLYRIVVADASTPRDGRAIDTIGHYNPNTDPGTVDVDVEAAKKWLSNGAQPTTVVKKLFKQAGIK